MRIMNTIGMDEADTSDFVRPVTGYRKKALEHRKRTRKQWPCDECATAVDEGRNDDAEHLICRVGIWHGEE